MLADVFATPSSSSSSKKGARRASPSHIRRTIRLRRFLRTSCAVLGPSGLAGIYPSVGPVARPLLEFRREDLRSYLREIGQTWREDSTNRIFSGRVRKFASD